MATVSFTLNGKPARITVDENRMLLWVLRDDLGLTGTKFGCGQALCGACTVLVNNEAVRSCATPRRATSRASRSSRSRAWRSDGRLHPHPGGVREAPAASSAATARRA